MYKLSILIWRGVENATVEHCTVIHTPDYILMQSTIEGPVNDVHTVVEYEMELDTAWRVCSFDMKMDRAGKSRSLTLLHNKAGEWIEPAVRGVLPELNGCMDLDISLTPFTNTLPIKRLPFKTGESRDFNMVYIDLPSFEITAQRQRYTALGNDQFIYEGLDTGYRNEITFTPEGFIWHYPNLFELVAS